MFNIMCIYTYTYIYIYTYMMTHWKNTAQVHQPGPIGGGAYIYIDTHVFSHICLCICIMQYISFPMVSLGPRPFLVRFRQESPKANQPAFPQLSQQHPEAWRLQGAIPRGKNNSESSTQKTAKNGMPPKTRDLLGANTRFSD